MSKDSNVTGQLQADGTSRITPAVAQLVRGFADAIRHQIVPALPPQASLAAQALVAEAVMDVLMRDWVENENTNGLEPDDVDDLKSFVELAADIAGPEEMAAHHCPVFQATLKGLLGDWLENWNADGASGPPLR